MSGCAGGNRILNEDVSKVVQHYTHYVLQKYKHYQTSSVTGSYNCTYNSPKPDFGDIDIIVYLTPNAYKPQIKKAFADFISTFPDDIIVPFKSQKYKGKKYLNTGEIISVLYPNPWKPGEFVQIDNIIAYSMDEFTFKNEFLSIPGIKQGLMLGLIKCAILENPEILPTGWKGIALKNQELEYNLSSWGLTLRLVTLDENYKTLDKADLFTISRWEFVMEILKDYNFYASFEEILEQIKKTIHHPRSINRIKGIFKSMVSVKSGEIGTPKGNEKEYALKLIEKL